MLHAWIALAYADTCGAYLPPETTEIGGIPEASGLAVSRTRDEVLFTHEDKGSGPVLYAVDPIGSVVGDHTVTNAENEDWEDIAAAPCPDEGDCLYIGDIGDNDLDRASITVYVVREPAPGDERIKAIERWSATYPDGPRDAETLLMMPCSGRLHVVTKDPEGLSTVYRFPAEIDGLVTLEEVARIEIEGTVAEEREVTGGDWDADGDRLALRTSGRILEWVTDPEQPNAHWSESPVEIPVAATEAQGEAVAYGLAGELWTGTEGGLQLGRYPCADLREGEATCVFPQTGRACGCATGDTGSGLGWLGVALLAYGRTMSARRSTRKSSTTACSAATVSSV